ncbi:MAG: hypothetical protein PVG07_02435 [Acidobacteriota bacterium]|jgi:hypothetical protein
MATEREGRSDETRRPEYFEASLSVLGYREEGEWVALALEMDLRGYGATWEEALDDLRDLVDMQITFALSKGAPEMIWKDAGEEYWRKFERARKAQHARLLRALRGDRRKGEARLHAGGLEFPPPHVIAAQKDRFLPANG